MKASRSRSRMFGSGLLDVDVDEEIVLLVPFEHELVVQYGTSSPI